MSGTEVAAAAGAGSTSAAATAAGDAQLALLPPRQPLLVKEGDNVVVDENGERSAFIRVRSSL